MAMPSTGTLSTVIEDSARTVSVVPLWTCAGWTAFRSRSTFVYIPYRALNNSLPFSTSHSACLVCLALVIIPAHTLLQTTSVGVLFARWQMSPKIFCTSPITQAASVYLRTTSMYPALREASSFFQYFSNFGTTAVAMAGEVSSHPPKSQSQVWNTVHWSTDLRNWTVQQRNRSAAQKPRR